MRELRQLKSCHANLVSDVRNASSFVPAGFSLIELLITLAVILILTTMYWSNTANPERGKNACAQNLRKMHLVMEIYAKDNSDKFPVLTGARTAEEPLDRLVPHYTSDTSIFICPASRDSSLPSGESIRNRRISYAYYMGRRPGGEQEVLMSDRQVDTQPKEAGQFVFSQTGKSPGNNHRKNGGNFLFGDGHVDPSGFRAPF